MKKLLLIAALIVAFLLPMAGGAVELNNVTSRGVDGNLNFYDVSGNIIMTLDAANRRLTIPDGSLLEIVDDTIELGDVSYTFPSTNGDANQFLQTDGSGVLSWAGGASTAWDDLGAADAAKTHAFTTFAQTFTSTKTDGDMFTFKGLGAFGDVSVMRIEQNAGLATDGTVLEVISADADVDTLLVTANGTSVIQVLGSGAIGITGLEFSVSATTGAITINDGGDAGQISIEGTVLDINSLDFVGAGAITSAASSAITINPNAGDAAGEDLIITANNIQLTALGAMTLSPDADVATAIDATDTNYTNALSVGTNAILGTTGVVTYTNWNINADGDFAGVDATFTGAVNVGVWKQDAVVAATGNTTITLNGTGSGGVTIGGISEGTITLGAAASAAATLVDLPSTVDMTISGGSLTVTDTAESDTVTITNNTMVTSDLLVLSADGTRTSDNVIEIVDGATTASTIGITAVHQTSGDGIRYTNAGAGILTGAAFVANVTGAFTGYYFLGESAGTDEFTVKKNGATVIAGAASTNMLTVTTGDVQIDDGLIEIDTDEDDMSYIKRNQGVTTPAKSVFKVWEAAAAADSPAMIIDQDATAAASYGLQIDSAGGTIEHMNIGAAAGDGILATVPASYTGQLFKSNLLAWLGTSGEGGVIDIVTTAAATQEVGQGIRLNYLGTGTAGTAVTGKGLFVHADAGYKLGESLVYLDTLFNTAIHINNNGVSADGIKIEVPNAYTGQGIIADLGEWTGTVNEGFIHIESDAAATAVVGQALRINLRDSLVDVTAISGKAIYAKEVSPFKEGTYLAHFESTSNGAAFFSGEVSLQAAAPLVGGSPLVLDGTTADATNRVTVTVTDPTAARVLTIADATGTVMLSTLAANGPGLVNSVTGASNSLIWEGTADGSEITLDAADATAAVVYRLANAAAGTYGFVPSTLATNAPLIANSIWGMTNGLAMGGATGDANELQLMPMGDPAADKYIKFPVLNDAAAMISTLVTNDVDVANSVWGVSNGLAFGGASGADGFEITLTPANPTADRTVTIPNRTGQVQLAGTASTLTPGANIALTVGLSNLYTLTQTDNTDGEITFSAGGTSGDEITIVITTSGTDNESITFHATLVSSAGAIVAGTTAARYMVIRFMSDGSHWYEVSRSAAELT